MTKEETEFEEWFAEGDSTWRARQFSKSDLNLAYTSARQKGQEEIERLQEQYLQDLKSLARFDVELKKARKEIDRFQTEVNRLREGV